MIAMTDDLIIDNDGCEFDIYLRVADGHARTYQSKESSRTVKRKQRRDDSHRTIVRTCHPSLSFSMPRMYGSRIPTSDVGPASWSV
jgi:hypothetical protein